MWAIPCKCFVCLQLQDALTCLGLCKTTLKNSSRKCGWPLLYRTLTWKRLMSRGFPAFFRQFWLHFRKNFRKNLFMWQRETNKPMPATGSHNITRCGVQIKQQIKHRLLILHCFMTKVLCKNTSKPLRRIPPCISFYELLSQLAINLPGQIQHPPATLSPAAKRDGGCAVATMKHSVAIPASLNLSVRGHINSTCHALLSGWDGKYGYPHQ